MGTPIGEWTCPDCGVMAPVYAGRIRKGGDHAVMSIEAVDVEAHLLTHTEADRG